VVGEAVIYTLRANRPRAVSGGQRASNEGVQQAYSTRMLPRPGQPIDQSVGLVLVCYGLPSRQLAEQRPSRAVFWKRIQDWGSDMAIYGLAMDEGPRRMQLGSFAKLKIRRLRRGLLARSRDALGYQSGRRAWDPGAGGLPELALLAMGEHSAVLLSSVELCWMPVSGDASRRRHWTTTTTTMHASKLSRPRCGCWREGVDAV
jgi:hypothetical protein